MLTSIAGALLALAPVATGTSTGIALTVQDDLCLGPEDDFNGAYILMRRCNDSISEVIRAGEDGEKWIFPNAGGRCLDVINGNASNGAWLQIWDCFEGNTNQEWSWSRRTADIFQLSPAVDDLQCVDLKDGDVYEGATVQLWKCFDHNENQMFGLEK